MLRSWELARLGIQSLAILSVHRLRTSIIVTISFTEHSWAVLREIAAVLWIRLVLTDFQFFTRALIRFLFYVLNHYVLVRRPIFFCSWGFLCKSDLWRDFVDRIIHCRLTFV